MDATYQVLARIFCTVVNSTPENAQREVRGTHRPAALAEWLVGPQAVSRIGSSAQDTGAGQWLLYNFHTQWKPHGRSSQPCSCERVVGASFNTSGAPLRRDASPSETTPLQRCDRASAATCCSYAA